MTEGIKGGMDGLRRVIAIDFDGCLCREQFPEVGPPNWPVIRRALAEQRAGSCLVLWTCREGDLLEEAVEACQSWGLEFEAVNENPAWRIAYFGSDCRKVGADEYWDDRAVRLSWNEKENPG